MQLNRLDEDLLCRGYWEERGFESFHWWRFERNGKCLGRGAVVMNDPELVPPGVGTSEGTWEITGDQHIRLTWTTYGGPAVEYEVLELSPRSLRLKADGVVRQFQYVGDYPRWAKTAEERKKEREKTDE